jgi:RNA polymerase sigma factor (sigma-70 family)
MAPIDCTLEVGRREIVNALDAPGRPVSHSIKSVTDSRLLQRIARADPQSKSALEELFVRHSEPLLHFLTRVLRSDNEAEDIVHDCFIRVAETAGTYQDQCHFRTWLFTMAMNLVRSQHRHSTMKARLSETVALKNVRRLSTSSAHDPVQTAERRELLDKVDAALNVLGDSERETFLLYWYGELNYAEISELTGVTVSAAKVRVHRALARVTKLLGGLK